MKKNMFLFTILIGLSTISLSQTSDGYIPSNRYISTLEKNLLFNATSRYQVTVAGTQANSVSSYLSNLFDGKMAPYYTSGALSTSDPLVIEISGLPKIHTQTKSWIGWSTRYYQCVKFKIEGYNEFNGANAWVTIADVSDNAGYQYMVSIPGNGGAFTKLRFSFYEGLLSPNSAAGRIGLSELFFLHPEAASTYDGLMVQYDKNMNVGIGTSNIPAGYKLAVDGKLITEEVTVKLSEQWPDYVFDPEYKLRSLSEVEQFIKANNHLPEIPSEAEVKENGIGLGEMNARLLQKIEELTMYLIEMKKENDNLRIRLETLENKRQ